MLDIPSPRLAPDLVAYGDAWALQREIHGAVAEGSRPDTLLLLEHEAVFTAGARTSRTERPSDGTPVIDVDRGGKITWHGPGQLVGYPIVRLREPVDVVAHVRRLENALLDVVLSLGAPALLVEGRSGVWVRRPLSVDKVAAIGVRVQRGVTMHGFSLNCNNSLLPFSSIVPCGITDAGVTTLSEVLGRDVAPSEVVDAVAAAMAASFGSSAAERAA